MKSYFVEHPTLTGWNPYTSHRQPANLEYLEDFNQFSFYKGKESFNQIYLIFSSNKDEVGYISIDTLDKTIINIYVNPNYRRQGLGTKLIQLASVDFNGIRLSQGDIYSFHKKKDRSDARLSIETLTQFYVNAGVEILRKRK